MAPKTETVSIDGINYQITQLTFGPGSRLFTRLLKTLGPVIAEGLRSLTPEKKQGLLDRDLSNLLPSDFSSISSLVEMLTTRVSEEDIDHLFDVLAVNARIQKKNGWVVLKDVMEVEFAGRIPHAFKFLAQSLRVNYGDFLGGLGQPSPEDVEEGKPSPSPST